MTCDLGATHTHSDTQWGVDTSEEGEGLEVVGSGEGTSKWQKRCTSQLHQVVKVGCMAVALQRNSPTGGPLH